MQSQDEKYMRRALELAQLAEGDTSPNPMVGCVIVNDGEIVGEGYHHKAGQPHAEVNALRSAGSMAAGATAYVTLEPCSHYGRTGPCCRALAAAGVRRVVAACEDPNPQVAGQGLEYLRRAGVEVECGVCRDEAARLNEKFFTWITENRPFVSLKYAMTLDGKIAAKNGDSKWITGIEARTYAHRLRRQHDAVLVGIGTVLEDDPELTTRLVKGKNAVRVVLDSKLRVPLTAKVLDGAAPTIVATGTDVSETKLAVLQCLPNVDVLQIPLGNSGVDLHSLMKELAERQLTSVLVEGGSGVLGAFKDVGLGDRVYAFIAPKIIGGAEALSPLGGTGSELISDGWQLDGLEYMQLGSDVLLTGRVLKGGA